MKKIWKTLVYHFEWDFIENNLDYIRSISDEVIIITATDDYQGKIFKEHFEWVECFISGVFDYLENSFYDLLTLKYIVNAYTGNWDFDLDFLAQNNIIYKNSIGFSSQAVAELWFTMMLNLWRNVLESKNFAHNRWKEVWKFQWTESFWKTVWIIWMGCIGTIFWNMCSALWMNVIYHSREEKKNQFEFKNMSDLLSESDIVFLSVTENKDSNKMINAKIFSQLKDNALFLNVSWTNTIDWEWIYATFTSSNIKIWTDFLNNDEMLKQYLQSDSFYTTNHSGFNTVEAKERNVENFMNNLKGARP